MKISEIDEGFVDIIDYLNNNGFCTFASCDGVLEHHTDKDKPSYAYIAFMKSDKIIDLMAAFLRDKSSFSVSFSSSSNISPFELYGNIVEGTTYSVYFDNLQGQLTDYFSKIIHGIVEEKIDISDEERGRITRLENCLDKDEGSEISIQVDLNKDYQPYTRKSGKTNCIIITTKEGVGYYKDLHGLACSISEKYGIPIKSDSFEEDFEDENEFLVINNSNTILEYCFVDEDLSKAIEMIGLARMEAPKMENLDVKEADYDAYESYYKELEYDDLDELDFDGFDEELDDDFGIDF